MSSGKVLHTPIRFYPYPGGVEHSTYHLCRHLVRLGWDVEVLCAAEGTYDSTEEDGVTVKRLPYVFKVANTNITPRLPLELIARQCDVIHTYMPTPWSSDLSVIVGKIRGKKTVISIKNDMRHTAFFAGLLNTIYINTLYRVTLALSDRILVVNPAWISSFTSTARILTRYRHKITIVPNGIDLERFYCTGIRRELIVLFISVLDKYHEFKGLLYLFDAMRTVAAKYPCAKLLIIGDGDARGYYESLAVDYGVEKFVEFTGHIRQEDLKEYYSRAAVFVLPSTDTEGFGNVLLEAMACGTPVVTTEVAGMAREIEDAGAGFVVESRDSAALAAAIVALCGDEKLRERMGRNGADLVRANYSWRGVAEQVAAVYEALLRGARP